MLIMRVMLSFVDRQVCKKANQEGEETEFFPLFGFSPAAERRLGLLQCLSYQYAAKVVHVCPCRSGDNKSVAGFQGVICVIA